MKSCSFQEREKRKKDKGQVYEVSVHTYCKVNLGASLTWYI